MKILVVCHVFYPHLWPELRNCIEVVSRGNEIDCYVTAPQEYPEVAAWCAEDSNRTLETVGNRGYDIWPFISVLKRCDLEGYDLLVKLHTKRDMPRTHTAKKFPCGGGIWRQALLRFCSNEENWRKTLACFKNAGTGMVTDSLCIYDYTWDPAKQHYTRIAEEMERLGIPRAEKEVFVAGAMFAARPELFRYLRDAYSEEEFPPADKMHTEGLPHVLERVMGFAVCGQQHEVVSFDGKDYLKEISKQKLRRFFSRLFFYRQVTSHRTIIRILGIPVCSFRAHQREEAHA